MKLRFSKTEVFGLIFLALLIAAITVSAVLMKGCEGLNREGEPMVILKVDSSNLSGDSDETPARKKKKTKRGRKGASSNKRSNSGKNKKSQNPTEFRDPFSDTIPIEN